MNWKIIIIKMCLHTHAKDREMEKWAKLAICKWMKINELETAALKTLQTDPASALACSVWEVCLNLFDLKDENTNKRAASNQHESIKLVSAYLNHELIRNRTGQKVPPSQWVPGFCSWCSYKMLSSICTTFPWYVEVRVESLRGK